MDYTKYSVEELASEESFIQWANQSDPPAGKYWDLFLLEHPEMSLKISQARTLVLNLRKAEMVRHSERQIEAMWHKIEEQIEHSEQTPSHNPKRAGFYTYGIAATVSLAFICLAAWYALYPFNGRNAPSLSQQESSASDYVEEINTSGNVLVLHLNDGSTVALENDSRLKYKKSYAGEAFRQVYLTGEAFFEVAKDPAQPFLVHTDQVVTRVLGTSFRVKAPGNEKDVVVSVKTGKVSVYTLAAGEPDEESQKNGVILLPNQQVTYLRDQDSFGKALVPEPEILLSSVKDADFVFENTPIRDVFHVLEKAYGVEIIFDADVMNNCFITAPLGSEPMFEKLRIICRTIGARYETIDARVVITSTGC